MRSDHRRLVDEAKAGPFPGSGNFKKSVNRALRQWGRERGDCMAETMEMVYHFPLNPDAWRLGVDTEIYGNPVLLVETLEIEVTSPISEAKHDAYDRLWWAFDGTETAHFRAWISNRFGVVSQLPLPWFGPDSPYLGVKSLTEVMGSHCDWPSRG